MRQGPDAPRQTMLLSCPGLLNATLVRFSLPVAGDTTTTQAVVRFLFLLMF